jgi:hypothetical protein
MGLPLNRQKDNRLGDTVLDVPFVDCFGRSVSFFD